MMSVTVILLYYYEMSDFRINSYFLSGQSVSVARPGDTGISAYLLLVPSFPRDSSQSFTAIKLKLSILLIRRPVRMPIHFEVVALIFKVA